MAKIKIKQVKSGIGRTKSQKATLVALGLKKLHQVVEHDDSPAILGMIRTVGHLLEVQK